MFRRSIFSVSKFHSVFICIVGVSTSIIALLILASIVIFLKKQYPDGSPGFLDIAVISVAFASIMWFIVRLILNVYCVFTYGKDDAIK
jgi:hypothetical protein